MYIWYFYQMSLVSHIMKCGFQIRDSMISLMWDSSSMSHKWGMF